LSTAGPGARAWLALAALLALGALLAWPIAPQRIDWQPLLAASEPWRALSAAAVHYSALHLAANLAGAALVGALGVVADVPWRSTLAWFAAWPLTQLGLLARPELAHYGGLSGVLHAGVVIAAVHLVAAGPRRRRLVGATILLGLVVKLLSESPWGPVLQQRAGWDIAIAPFAHASGAAAGLLCALLAAALPSRTHD
jgi:rhomboid family GlyGly-CTERM serine protease